MMHKNIEIQKIIPVVIGLMIALISLTLFIGFTAKEVPSAFDGSDPEDFPNYYFSGRRFLQGNNVYVGIKEDVYETFGWDYAAYPADPPAGIIFFSPFSLLPYKVSWAVFSLSSVLISLGIIFFTAKKVGYSTGFSSIISVIFLGSAPFLFLLKRNHMEMWLVFFAVLGWNNMKKGKEFLGGFLWGIAGVLKLFPLLWLFVTIHRNKKVFYKASALTGLLILFSFFIVGFENSVYFIVEIIPRSNQWYGVIGNYSIISLSHALNLSRLGWVLAVVLGCVVFYPKLWTGPVDDIFIKGVSLSLILPPLYWVNYQVLLFPCIVILSTHVPLEKKAPRWLFLITSLLIWGWPADLNLANPVFNILLSSLPPIIATMGVFFLSHFYIYKAVKH